MNFYKKIIFFSISIYMDYNYKYLKYKNKYFKEINSSVKQIIGGNKITNTLEYLIDNLKIMKEIY